MAEIKGQCLCGAVKITVRDPAGWLGACHCRICQRWSGGFWAGFPAAEDTVTIRGEVREYPSSMLANRGFCATCGTQLWMRNREDAAPYDMMPGLFEAAKDWPMKSEIYVDEAYCAYALKGTHKTASAAAYREKNPEVKGV